jgi:NAD(P)-dependent dehydrogenase (short-subunit alcohol dehydrogenase family)
MHNAPPRTVIITGASSGIGLALAKALLEQGNYVVGNSRSSVRLAATGLAEKYPNRFAAISGEIGSPHTAQMLFEAATSRFGPVDVLINNAGIFQVKPLTQWTSEEVDAIIDTNMKGFIYPSQEAVKHMLPRRSGHIINITASIGLQPSGAVPATVPVLIKGGINQATKALALELAKHNILVNAVAPGIIDTPLHRPETLAQRLASQPLGRIGNTQDIVDAVLYLINANYTSGLVLAVDGATSAGR